MGGKKKKISLEDVSLVVLSISIFIILILSPLFLYSYSEEYYQKHMLKTPEQLLPNNKTFETASKVMFFLKGEGDLVSDFTKEEETHMYDVRKIMLSTRTTLIVALVIFILLISYHSRKIENNEEMSKILKSIYKGSMYAGILMVVLVALVLIDFQGAFTLFHNLFFPQGNWMFPDTSLLITIFPESYFIAISKSIMITTIAISVLIAGFSFYTNKKIGEGKL